MAYYNKERAEVLKYIIGTPSNVLEIGCGNGSFGKLIKQKFSCFVTGVEIATEPANIAKQFLDIVHNKELHSLINDGILKREYDLIVLNDVVEHIENPWDFLNCLKHLITENGFIIASIPNFIYIDNLIKIIINKNFEYNSSGILDRTHLRFFAKRNIIHLFESQGFKVDLIEPLNFNSTFKWKFLKFITVGWIDEFLVYQYVIRAKVE